MKKEITTAMSFGMKVKLYVQSVGEGLANIYSQLLEERVSVMQSWKILHASVAFCFAVFSWCSVLVHLLLLAWFLFTLWDCKRAGIK